MGTWTIRKTLALASLLALAISPVLVAGTGAEPARAATAVPATLPSGPAIRSGEMVLSGHGCIDYSASNGILLEPCNGNVDEQQWTIEADGTIRVLGECLRIHAGVGPDVDLYTCDGDSYEQWTISSGQIKSVGISTKCLDTDDQQTSSGTQIVVDACESVPTQDWSLPSSSELHQVASALLNLQDSYDTSNGLFLNASGQASTCVRTDGQFSGNCWWWSANALYTAIDFLESAGTSWTGYDSVAADVSNTYSVICALSTGDGCPTSSDYKTDTNFFQNSYNDDTANWALTWLNAYQLSTETTTDNNYKYLAENLWYYITNNGWDQAGGTPDSCGVGGAYDPSGDTDVGAGGVFQFDDPTTAHKNLGANALYLRLSAWLYNITGNSVYLNGIPDGSSTIGGALAESSWLIGTSADPSPMINLETPSLTIDSSGSRFLFDGAEIPPTSGDQCTAPSMLQETQHNGALFSAMADMYQATSETFYLDVADNLAQTTLGDTLSSPTPDAGVYSTPPLIDATTTADGVLSEACEPTTEPSDWPDDCDFSKDVWLPGKGIFMRGLFCLSQTLSTAGQPDSALGDFIGQNADSVWANDQDAETGHPGHTDLNEFGFIWDDFETANIEFATQAAAVDGLTADLGGSTDMC